MSWENVRLAVRGHTALLIIHEDSPRAPQFRGIFGGLEVPVLVHSAVLVGRELRLRVVDAEIPLQGHWLLYEMRGRPAGMSWAEFVEKTEQDGLWVSIRIPEGGI